MPADQYLGFPAINVDGAIEPAQGSGMETDGAMFHPDYITVRKRGIKADGLLSQLGLPSSRLVEIPPRCGPGRAQALQHSGAAFAYS